jgi:hypothetical protein
MIGHVTLGTNGSGEARAYDNARLATIDATRLMEFGEKSGQCTVWGVALGQPAVVVTNAFNGEPAFAGNGNMIALLMDSWTKVGTLRAKALELGGTCDGPPGIRPPKEMGFYGAYFRDPEENKLCSSNVGSSQ